MAQLPNIISKERSIFKIFYWIIKSSLKTSTVGFYGQLVFIILVSLIPFLSSYNFGQILTTLSRPDPSFQKILIPLILVMFFNYIPSVLHFIRMSFEMYNERNLRKYFEQEIIQKQSELDIATIEQPEFQDLLEQVNNRGQSSMISVLWWFFSMLRDVIKIIVALGIFLSITKIGIVIMIACIMPIYIYEVWRGKNLAKIWTESTEANRRARMKASLFSNKTTVLEVKFFNTVKFFKEKILQIRNEKDVILTKDDIKTAPARAIADIFPTMGVLVITYITLQKIFVGTIPLGTLSFIWGSAWAFSSALETLLRGVGRLSEQKVHANKLIDLLEMKPYIFENLVEGSNTHINIAYTLEFKNVSFTYPGAEREILTNISFTINNGSEVAIVGLNGAGKTTLLRLITRVYDPTTGVILLNGKDLREYSLAEYRKILGVMMQDYHTYSDETIRDNIITNKDFDETLFNEVTTQTGVTDYVKQYDKGFDQMIGTEFRGGVELSKGQKQKLALARVLYRNAPIIILDEPTAAIDAVSEDTIFKALRENHTEQTRIIISHKFSNVRDADQIILIEHGTIIEQGTHDKLMKKKKGRYAEMFNLQAEGYK